MTITQVWGALLIFILCPLLGGLPLIDWLVRYLSGRRLADLGTGNISVAAAFYHGGRWVGILAVLSEAAKGILAVWLARAFFPAGSAWELLALIALVMGRYWFARGAGTTNALWGIAAHDWQGTLLILLVGGISFTIFRDRRSGRLVGLVLLASILSLRHFQEPAYVPTVWALALLLAWICQNTPDDLDLPPTGVKPESRQMFRFFRGERALLSLNQPLRAEKVGHKAAALSQLKRWGYAVPDGWVLLPGDDPQFLLDWLAPSAGHPFAVRSSALGEDGETASAAGQYATVLGVTSPQSLQEAIVTCLTSYDRPAALQYRRDRGQEEREMAVLVQVQIAGAFSGVAFSRDPVNPLNPAVVVEALPGDASRVVSGRFTPERFEIEVSEGERKRGGARERGREVPLELVERVAVLARELEGRYHGVPQDLEWTYDGEQLWLLQVRPITNLQPLWTRKIAAEVIPGKIRPLTWSINRPLTCGVWGEIFTLVLGKRAADLDFEATAALHWQHAYFNATLLGEIFRRMGLPPESLEFLTRGAEFSQPPLMATLGNLPGLLRLWQRERNLARDFARDDRRYFTPTLNQLACQPAPGLSPEDLKERIEKILAVLKRATYYSILAPLSLAWRQAIAKVPLEALDNSQTPEVASLRSLEELAGQVRQVFGPEQLASLDRQSLWQAMADSAPGQEILAQFQQWLDCYGYLSQVGTDIAVPRWREDPEPVRQLLAQLTLSGLSPKPQPPAVRPSSKGRGVQERLHLKGRSTAVYSQLLAHLRWSFVALEAIWWENRLLQQPGDIFFLEFAEIARLVPGEDQELRDQLPQMLARRRQEFQENRQQVPHLAYGNPERFAPSPAAIASSKHLQGIAASPGLVEGRVKVLQTLETMAAIDRETILVVPYTDSGWAPLLARAGGLIAEVGGALSHGAIVAREYGIPAVMDVADATRALRDGQRVRLDGQRGIVEIL